MKTVEIVALSVREGYAVIRDEGALCLLRRHTRETLPVHDMRRLVESDVGLELLSEAPIVELEALRARVDAAYRETWLREAISDGAQAGETFPPELAARLMCCCEALLKEAQDAGDGALELAIRECLRETLIAKAWSGVTRVVKGIDSRHCTLLASAVKDALVPLLRQADEPPEQELLSTWLGASAQHVLLAGEAFARSGMIEQAADTFEKAVSIADDPTLYGEGLLAHARLMLSDVGAEAFSRARDEAAALAELDWFAARYDALRRAPKGETRTSRMQVLANIQCRWVVRTSIVQQDVAKLFSRGGAGDRVVALTCCDALPEAAPVDIVVDGILSAMSGFEQWRALIAASVIVAAFGPEVSEPCVQAMHSQQDDPNSMLNEPKDGSRRVLVKPIEERFVQKIGLNGQNAGQLARQWIGAGGSQGHSGREVLVLGNDLDGAHLELTRRLGERLAIHGWRVIATDGINVGRPLIEGFLSVRGARQEARLLTGSVAFVRCTLALAIGGDLAVADECKLLSRRGTSILPLPLTGGVAESLAVEARKHYVGQGIPDAFLELLSSASVPASVPECAVRVLNLLASPAAPGGSASLRNAGT